MIPMTLADIATVVRGTVADGNPLTTVTAPVRYETARLEPGGMFVAFAGSRVDGHDLAPAAVAAGAAAVLASRPVGVPAVVVADVGAAYAALAAAVLERLPSVRTVAVTGSSGKTSTKDLIGQVLAQLGPTVAPPGNRNNEIGVPETVLQCDHSTRFLVTELGACRRGDIAALTRIVRPSTGVVVGVGTADVALRLHGAHFVTAALAAAAAALEHTGDVNLIAAVLSDATPVSPGRMRVLERGDGVTVLDDTYNANPESMTAALRTLTAMRRRARRTVAVLGQMNELGEYAAGSHRRLGRLVASLGIDQLITVGDGAVELATAAGAAGVPTEHLPDRDRAIRRLHTMLRPDDLVLVKGSRGVGLEAVVNALTAS